MTQRFERAYNALVDAFFNGTLAKGTCLACACGNIVLAAQGAKLDRLPTNSDENGTLKNKLGMIEWYEPRTYGFCVTGCKFHPLTIDTDTLRGKIAKQVTELTGYNTAEMCEIETAFEGSTRILYHNYHEHDEQELLQDQYRGLCAVFEVLCQLDGETVDYKTKLKSHPKLVTV